MTSVVATFDKNARERLQIEFSTFKGYDLIGIRIYSDRGGGAWVPTPKGITFRVEMLPDIVKAMQTAETKARAAGRI